MLARAISAERGEGSQAYRLGYAAGSVIGATAVCAAATWGVWTYLQRADRPAVAEIKTALAAKLAAGGPSQEGSREGGGARPRHSRRGRVGRQ